AQGSGRGLPGAAAVLPQPPEVLAQRAPAARGQESGGVAVRSGTSALAGDAGLQALRPEPGRLSGPRLPPSLAAPNRPPVQPARRPGCHPTVTRKCLLLNHAKKPVITADGTWRHSLRLRRLVRPKHSFTFSRCRQGSHGRPCSCLPASPPPLSSPQPSGPG